MATITLNYLGSAASDAARKIAGIITENSEKGMDLKEKKRLAVEAALDVYTRMLGDAIDRDIDRDFLTKEEIKQLEDEINRICLRSKDKLRADVFELLKKLNKTTVKRLNNKTVHEEENLNYNKNQGFYNESQRSTNQFQWNIPALVVILAIVIATLLWWNVTKQHGPDHVSPGNNNKCKIEMKHQRQSLQNNFVMQPQRLWNVMDRVCMPHICDFNNNIKAPVRLFLVAFDSTSFQTVSCIVRPLASTFAQENYVFMDMSDYITNDINSGKEKLHDEIQSRLLGGQKVFIIENIDKISFEVAKLYFKFCDSENVQHPEALFIFIANLSLVSSPSNRDALSVERYAVKHLEYTWNDSDPGEVRALVARITDVVILVENEDELIRKGIC